MAEDLTRNPWDELVEILESRDADRLHEFLEQIGPAETARAISRLDQEYQTRLLLLLEPADAADLIEDIPGCVFAERCPFAIADCRRVFPDFKEVAPEHFVACIRTEHIDEFRQQAGDKRTWESSKSKI